MTVMQIIGYASPIVILTVLWAGVGWWASYSRQHHLERDEQR